MGLLCGDADEAVYIKDLRAFFSSIPTPTTIHSLLGNMKNPFRFGSSSSLASTPQGNAGLPSYERTTIEAAHHQGDGIFGDPPPPYENDEITCEYITSVDKAKAFVNDKIPRLIAMRRYRIWLCLGHNAPKHWNIAASGTAQKKAQVQPVAERPKSFDTDLGKELFEILNVLSVIPKQYPQVMVEHLLFYTTHISRQSLRLLEEKWKGYWSSEVYAQCREHQKNRTVFRGSVFSSAIEGDHPHIALDSVFPACWQVTVVNCYHTNSRSEKDLHDVYLTVSC
ncbi:hypothetical protein K474DRAFT_1669767 [Panus rudis PR-1116 ss-1]|nr:hypothetical protein K474DRAFT_1669767 [Panus rudis PR-1116 ss-1]